MQLLRLLLIACVLWCGAHAAEPAWAHDQAAHHHDEVAFDGQDRDHDGASDVAHVGHHHCQVALQANDEALDDDASRAPLPLAARAAPLGSLSQAPQLEPPAA